MRRVKADSWAAALTPDQREELMVSYHTSALGVDEACELASEMSGRAVSRSMFASWYHNQRASWLIAQATARADEAAAASPADVDEKRSLAIRRAAFVASMDQLSADEVAALERNDIARRKLALDERRLALDEAKFEEAKKRAAQADAAENVTKDEALTPEQREARLREIFGLR